MDVTFITGPSGSGKTTLADRLVADGVPNVQELDAHPDGLPTAAHGQWLQWRAEELLGAAVRELAEHHSTVITGIVMPFDLIDTPTFTTAVDTGVRVRFLLLDRPWDDVAATMQARLMGEGWDPEDINEQLVINRRQQRRFIRQFDALYGARNPYVVRVIGGDLDHAADLAAESW